MHQTDGVGIEERPVVTRGDVVETLLQMGRFATHGVILNLRQGWVYELPFNAYSADPQNIRATGAHTLVLSPFPMRGVRRCRHKAFIDNTSPALSEEIDRPFCIFGGT